MRRCSGDPDRSSTGDGDDPHSRRRPRLRAAPEATGGGRSGGDTWSGWCRLAFALFPILFVVSAALNPLGTLSSSTLIPNGAP